ncbi:HIT family protein [Asanoa iriomotensis]|uniref:Histidine triad (HIT) protein n=1 Tax=Asanoa iriomotensis TaxID=234613 RepID=A0ABQ4C974_9ACTN|nr:HIT domain-containing protein [Asanoa iriomotensis]GIF59325.1 histidine triad (HIT) protein [Asanoa iriomotensis]
MDDCPICAKHRGEGPLSGGPEIWRDDLVVVTHWPGPALLGYLFVEPLRHAAHLEDLTDVEAAAVGSAARRAAIALRSELDAEYVFSAVIGTGVARMHFHQHVFPRYRGTPDDTPWHASATWPDAPRGGEPEIAAVADRLRRYFTGV